MSVAMVGGLLVSSIVTGRIITATGRWKRYLVGGMVAGHRRPGPAVHDRRDDQPVASSAPSWPCSASASAPRCRTSCSPSRTTSPSPTSAPPARWSRSSARWAARSASRRSVRCSATRWRRASPTGLARLGIQMGAHEQGSIPDLATLPEPVRAVFEHAFGEATGHLFLVAVPFAVLALVCVLFIQRGAAAHHHPPRGRGGARRSRPSCSSEGDAPCHVPRLLGVPRAGGRRADPAGPPGHPRAGPARAPRPPAGVVPAAQPTWPRRARCGRRRLRSASASTRARSAARSRTWWTSGWSTARPTRPTAARRCSPRARTRGARLDEVNRHRRKYLDERLGDWSEDDLPSFVTVARPLQRRARLTADRSAQREPDRGVRRAACRRGQRAAGDDDLALGQRHRTSCRS